MSKFFNLNRRMALTFSIILILFVLSGCKKKQTASTAVKEAHLPLVETPSPNATSSPKPITELTAKPESRAMYGSAEDNVVAPKEIQQKISPPTQLPKQTDPEETVTPPRVVDTPQQDDTNLSAYPVGGRPGHHYRDSPDDIRKPNPEPPILGNSNGAASARESGRVGGVAPVGNSAQQSGHAGAAVSSGGVSARDAAGH